MGGITILLLLLCAGASVNTVVELQRRGIEGDDCKNEERLYHVQLRVYNATYSRYCGGSLITNQWILTAADCLKMGWTIEAVLGMHLGDKSITEKITEQPKVYKDKNYKEHDVMLLKLPDPTDFDHIKLPDCENRPTFPGIGAKVQIAGHGATAAAPDGTKTDESGLLKCAEIEVDHCVLPQNKLFLKRRPHESRFCSKNMRTQGCEADFGGGVEYNGAIYGVMSSGGRVGCNGQLEFMEVCKYKGWIEENTKS